MDVKEAIQKRRSIRKYQDRGIPEKILMELIEAARMAPSGNNAQPWRFKIVTYQEDREKLRENHIFKQDFVYTAPALIVCCADPRMYPAGEIDHELDNPNETRAIRDLAIASQNMVLRATELGLGTCYIGWTDKKKIKSVLNIPKEYIIPYVITVGYAAESPKQRPRNKIEDIVF